MKVKNNFTIKISQKEYQQLQEIAQRYELIRKILKIDYFEEPPVKNIRRIVQEFRKTGLYNELFLKSLEQGLKESSYFS